MTTDHPAPISNAISVTELRFREGALRGKLLGPGADPIPRQILILLDGREVATVNIRGSNPQEGPFTWFVPARFYDDGSHVFEIRIPTDGPGGAVLLGMFERELKVRHAPMLHSAAFCSSSGRIEGYAWNSVHPTDVLAIEIWERGELQNTFKCNLPTPAISVAEDTPAACGFSFTPHDIASWVTGRSRIIVPKFGETIAVDFASALDAVAVESIDVAEDLFVVVRRPAVLGGCTILAEIDGEHRNVRVQELADRVQLLIARPLADDGQLRLLTLKLQSEAQTLAEVSAEFLWSPPGGMLENSDFQLWSGDRLESWVLAPDLVARPGINGDGVVGPSRSLVIERLSTREPGLVVDEPVLISQTVDLGDVQTDGLDIEIVLRGPAGRMALQLSDASGLLGRTILDVGSQWASRRAFMTFDRMGTGKLTVSLQAIAEMPGRLDLAYLNLGPKGFQKATIGDSGAWVLGPAIANGTFRDWSKGLEFATSASTQETADGWTMFSSEGLTGVRAGLAQVTNSNGNITYGLSLLGQPPTGAIRVATQINPAIVARGGDWRIGLTVQQCPGGGGVSGGLSRINRLLVTSDPTSSDAPAAVIGYNIHVGAQPEAHALLLKDDSWTDAGVSLRRSAHDQHPIFLVFEFTNQHLDFIFTDVFMEPAPTIEKTIGAYSGFEDFNLLSQLESIEGLEAWRVGSRVDAGALGAPSDDPSDGLVPSGLPTPDVAWGPSTYPLVDIVIPVYNAEEHTLGCLYSIVQVTDIPYRLIVVNDGSAPSTSRALDAFAENRPWVQVIHNAENKGYTITANTGLKAGRSSWVVLLNSDTVVTPGWLQGLLQVGVMDNAIAMVGPLSNAATWQSVPAVRDRHGHWAINQVPPRYTLAEWAAQVRKNSPHAYPDVPLLNGFCTLMRRSALAEVGYLDEEVFPIGYGEEIDLCLRIAKAGHRLVIADDVYIFHHKSSSFGKERRAVLAKQGGMAVRRKHKDVNLELLEQNLATLRPILDVRQKLLQLHGGVA